MHTADRAAGIADALKKYSFGKMISCQVLLELVKTELGHEEILDSPQVYGDIKAQAIAPQTILHIIAGNTPHAGIQSICRGLLIGSHNLIKLPAAGMPELEAFVDSLPSDLGALIELSRELPDDWMEQCQAAIVFGNDDTIRHFSKLYRDDQIFIPHGHRISFAVVFEDEDSCAAKLAARDISQFDQQGCLSPHNVYVQEDKGISPVEFAAELAREMEIYNETDPRGAISIEEKAQITSLRESYEFRQLNESDVRIWSSEDSTDWTVIYEQDTQFEVSPLNRVVFVKPLTDINQLPDQLKSVEAYLGSIAVHPFHTTYVDQLRQLSASRFCPLGKSQEPSVFWHQDGLPQLAPLVRWVDFG